MNNASKPADLQNNETYCIVCSKKFKTPKSFKSHLKQYHGEGKIHECILCDTSFTVFEDLVAHIQEHRQETVSYFACNLCDQVFDEGRTLESHVIDHVGSEIINHYKRNLHDCSECGETFTNLIQLCSHRKEKHVDQKYHCGQCNESFSRAEDLYLHSRIHRGLSLLKCLCGKMFASSNNLAKHISKIHPGAVDESVLVMLNEGLPIDFKNVKDWKDLQSNIEVEEQISKNVAAQTHQDNFVVLRTKDPTATPKVFERKHKCPVQGCQLAFVKFETVAIHINRNHPNEDTNPTQEKFVNPEPEEKIPCKICDEEFTTHPQLLEHFNKTHTTTRPFKCAVCSLMFSKLQTLKDHIDLIHESDKYRCDYCGAQFQKQASLSAHYKKHEGNETFICNTCQVPYTSRKQLIKHMRKIHIDGAHQCEYCDKTFIQRCDLVKHNRTHSGQKPFNCKVCGKSFAQASILKQHEVVHSGARKFVCIECGKAFQSKSNLTVHMRIHKGDRPFQCNLCPKRFLTSGHLTEHMRMHMGIKKFQCKNCLKQFTYQSSLIKHQRTHLGIKKYHCTACGKYFSQAGHLREHQLIHSGQKPFSCRVCGKKYRRYDVLKTHEKIHRTITVMDEAQQIDLGELPNNQDPSQLVNQITISGFNEHPELSSDENKPKILSVENLGTTSQYQDIVDAIRSGHIEALKRSGQ